MTNTWKKKASLISSHLVIIKQIINLPSHVFNLGTGGYISTWKDGGTKFSDYVKMRMLGPNTAYRRNQTYVFFLLCIKERCQVRSMTSMYFRKAFKKPGLGSKYISERNIADLSRSDATYAVYKQLRGSPPYFAANKKRAIAMVRQLGSSE